MKNILKALFFLVFLSPFVAKAQTDAISIATTILGQIKGVVSLALPIVFSLAILAFFWGIAKYVFSQSSESKMEGKGVLVWSLIALFVMTSLFGIISLAQDTFGVGGIGNFAVPKVNQGGSFGPGQ